jgi:hypothetical protein
VHEVTILRRAYPADMATTARGNPYGEVVSMPSARTRTWVWIAVAAAVLAIVIIALTISAGGGGGGGGGY